MKRINVGLFLGSLALLFIGVFFVYSDTALESAKYSSIFIKHIVFASLGLVAYIILTFIDFEKIKRASFIVFLVTMLFLVLTLAVGEVVNGARSWLGLWNFGIQPSEFAKIALLLYLSYRIELHQPKLWKRKDLLIYSLLVVLPFLLILLQPDLGTAFVFLPLGMAVFFVAGARFFDIALVILIGIGTLLGIILLETGFFDNGLAFTTTVNGGVFLVLIICACLCLFSFIGTRTALLTRFFSATGYISGVVMVSMLFARVATQVLKPYQISRLVSFINPQSDPLGSGWHILQSLNAIGSGGIAGRRFQERSVSNLRYLPQHLTDFMYSFVAEKWGFVGAAAIVILYMLILWQVIYVAIVTKSLCGKLFCVGFLAVFFTHFIVNTGMTLGFMPVTGIPLLLLSYGGSALFTCMIGLGIISSCHKKSVGTHAGEYTY